MNDELVYVLQHVAKTGDEENVKFIGVYSSEQNAKDAINRFKNKPGFSKFREGFNIDVYKLNDDHWVEGFVSG